MRRWPERSKAPSPPPDTRRQQRAQLPHGSARAAADPRDQRRSSELLREQRRAEGLAGRDRHQPELLDHRARHGAGAAAPVRHHAPSSSRRCRRCRARDIRACRRSTFSATSCRSSAAKKRRWRRETLKILGSDGGRDAAPGGRQRAHQPRAGDRRPHHDRVGGPEQKPSIADVIAGAARLPRHARRNSICRARRSRRSS